MSNYPIIKRCRIIKRFSVTHQKDMEYAQGRVYNDERFRDGKFISTTAIIQRNDNIIRTTSGNIYQIDEIK